MSSDGVTDYEFTPAENTLVRKLATRARVWGALSAIGGVICLVLAAVAALSATRVGARHNATLFVFVAIPQLSMGVSFLGAARALFAVVDTKGNDIPLFLTAIRHVTAALRVQVAVTVVFILTVAAMAASIYLIES